MTWKCLKLFFWFGLLVSSDLPGQQISSQPECEIYQAYINSDLHLWDSILLSQEIRLNVPDSTVLSFLIHSGYGYSAFLIGLGKDSAAIIQINKTISKALLYLDHFEPDAHMYTSLAALYGLSLIANPKPSVAMVIKGYRYLYMAEKMDDTSPYVWIQKGNINYFLKNLTNGKNRSVESYFLKAKSLFEQQTSVSCNWEYLNVVAFLGYTSYRAGNYAKAVYYYHESLRLEPDFKWVRDELLPRAVKAQLAL